MNETIIKTGDTIGSARDKKVLVLVVCYKAAESIKTVLDRIPDAVWNNERFSAEVLVMDDQSPDRTLDAAEEYSRQHPHRNLTILSNPKNQGYGATQKIGFRYAVKNGFDAVVLLHGDNRYSPERLPEMIGPIIDTEAEAVLGSRMIHKLAALKAGYPFYKWVGNQALSFMQNRILGAHLSEFHSGFRAYSVEAISSVPFEHNSNGFEFDTDIIIQLLDTGKRIIEVEVPTFHGSEISGAHGLGYAFGVIHSSILSRVMRLGIYYHSKFDYEPATNYRYKPKFGYPSSHQFAYERVESGTTVIDVGCGPGFMAEALAKKGVKTISIDRQIQEQTRRNSFKCIEVDLDKYDFSDDFGKVDYILVLDIIEHLKSPERFFEVIRQRFSRQSPTLVITTGNIAFLPMRVSLLFAGFHYGRRGILDMDHTRLFTPRSLKKTLELAGYTVIGKFGLPAPFPLALGKGVRAKIMLLINLALIAVSKGLFSYQIAVIAKPLPTLEHLLDDAFNTGSRKQRMGKAE